VVSVYVFSLLVNYAHSGVDVAQGVRNEFLKNGNHEVKYFFFDVPGEREFSIYEREGIRKEQMLVLQYYLTENFDVSKNYLVSDMLEHMKKSFGPIEWIEKEDEIVVYKKGKRVASLATKENHKYISTVLYFCDEKLIQEERYAGSLLCRKYYSTVLDNGRCYAQCTRVSYVAQDGKPVFDCIFDNEGKELYIFPDGRNLNKQQMIELFLKKICLSANDIVIIDRPAYLPFFQPLFTWCRAKIITVFHSGHFYEVGEEPGAIYLNHEYCNWFKYSDKICMMLVSTEEQKIDLKKKLQEFGCHVPKIEVVPVSGLDRLRYNTSNYRTKSLVTVSRLSSRKKIDWVILSVIEAHKTIPELELDIYGSGDPAYEKELRRIVEENSAEHYIHFKGHCNVKEIYTEYEIYVTASTWETLGLSVMEAVGAGNAVVGLNARYGNRLFIEHDKNGKLIDFSPEDCNSQEQSERIIHQMADAIVEIMRDKEKLKEYQAHSYKIAERFLNEKIEKKWLELLATV